MTFLQWLLSLLKPPKPKPTPVVVPAPPVPKPKPVPVVHPVAMAFEAFILINKIRLRNNRTVLIDSMALDFMADRWAAAMALAGAESHDQFKQRLITAVGLVAGAENVAYGQPDAAAVVAAWEASPGHLANILGDYTHAGLGYEVSTDGVPYWCLDLAKLS